MSTLSQATSGNLQIGNGDNSIVSQYIRSEIDNGSRNGDVIGAKDDSLTIDGQKISYDIQKVETTYESSPIEYIEKQITDAFNDGKGVVGDFWCAKAEIGRSGNIVYKLEYIAGEHMKDGKAIEHEKLPSVVDVRSLSTSSSESDRKTFEFIKTIDFTKGFKFFQDKISSGDASGKHSDSEHLMRAMTIYDNYSTSDKIVDVFVKTIEDKGGLSSEYVIVRESGLLSIHNQNFVDRYKNADSDYKEGLATNPITTYYEHPSRMMFYEKMKDEDFKETLRENMDSDSPQEQIFYSSRDATNDMIEDVAPIIDVPDSDLYDGTHGFYVLEDVVVHQEKYVETLEKDYDRM